jgi:hypothetical protein
VRIGVAVIVAAVALGLYNDFAIRWRVEHSLSRQLNVQACHRVTSEAIQSKNFFRCTVRNGGPAPYFLEVQGRCWRAAKGSYLAVDARPTLHGCLSPIALGGA